ncbi:MAG TPA: cytochrome b N-terminal domain-containing protein [Acidobacteriaceae bacterium]|nr:cytochrome b N-terminal domain-containing protein [Acidobacteriaceae bacterium]
MASRLDLYIDKAMRSRVWRSVFRSGNGSSTLHRSLAIQQSLFLHILPTKVRRRMLGLDATWYLGTLTLGTFLVLVITGILLMFYYHPSVPQAYADMKDLRFVVSSGLFLRNLHRWSAHAMVLLAFAHMFRVFYRGAYRPPREFNWVIGVVLLLITLLLSYTGYLLPWDQLAFWAITVGSNISSAVPVVGAKVHFLMLGGNQVNANALLRFYVLHCVILPLAAILFVAVHFWRIRKDGGLYVKQSDPAVVQQASETPVPAEIPEPAGVPEMVMEKR